MRTSTPEPTPLGIIWTQLKDVSHYLTVFAKQGLVIELLGYQKGRHLNVFLQNLGS